MATPGRALLFALAPLALTAGAFACTPSPATSVEAPRHASAPKPKPADVLAACQGIEAGARCTVEEPYGTRHGVCVGGDDGLPASCQTYEAVP